MLAAGLCKNVVTLFSMEVDMTQPDQHPNISGGSPFALLTRREHDVMLCVTQGMPNKLIGDNLGISQRTVEIHRANVFRKLRLRNAVELTNYVWQHRVDA